MVNTALFIGSHADDIELGAGATAAKLCADQWVVWVLVLTSETESAVAETRRAEARAGAQVLGVPSDRVIFADLPDGSLVCDGESVQKVRDLASRNSIDPDVVITHSQADSHKDHREARAIAVASFRRRVVLGFAVINSMVRAFSQYEGFRPSVFVDVTEFAALKFEALRQHKSQESRIDGDSVNKLLEEYGKRTASDRAEAFEMLVQEGVSPDLMSLVSNLNHSPFHQVWSMLLDDRIMTILHAEPVWRKRRDATWKSDRDREGIALIHSAFRQEWDGRVPLEDLSCEVDNAEEILEGRDILLSGGAVSNSLTRVYFNHFHGVRYVIDFTMPGYRDIRIRDKRSNGSIRARYEFEADSGTRRLLEDVGILTIMPNPLNRGRALIGCMGIHGYGSLACFQYLSRPRLLNELNSMIPLPIGDQGYQILVRYNVDDRRPWLDTQTFTQFEMESDIV